jgi:hypothetical protein
LKCVKDCYAYYLYTMTTFTEMCDFCSKACDERFAIEKNLPCTGRRSTKNKLLVKQFCNDTCKNTWLKQDLSYEISEKLQGSKRDLLQSVECMVASRKWLANYKRFEYNLERHARTKLICEWYCVYEKINRLEIVFMTALLREETTTKLVEYQRTLIGYWKELSKIHLELNDDSGIAACKTHIKYYSATRMNVVYLFGS